MSNRSSRGSSGTPDSGRARPAAGLGSTTCATASRSARCSTGTPRAATSSPSCRCCRPTSATSIPPTPIGICRRRRSCSRSPASGSSATCKARHDRARRDAAGVLHRPPDDPAPRQPEHRRRLPRHDAAAARLRPPAHRPRTLAGHDRRARRGPDRGLPGPPRARPRQHPAHTQRPAGGNPLAVRLRRAATPRARRIHPARAGDPAQALRPHARHLPQRTRGPGAARHLRPLALGRTPRPRADPARPPDRPARLRADGLRRGDLHLGRGPHVSCHGKRRKQRATPLTRETVATLQTWLAERAGEPDDPLFPAQHGGHLSRDGLERRLARHVKTAARTCPSLATKNVTAHVLRHTTAMRLLQANVDTSVIALWLGHEDPETTQTYLHADMTLKQRALERTTPLGTRPGRYQPSDKVLAFLEQL